MPRTKAKEMTLDIFSSGKPTATPFRKPRTSQIYSHEQVFQKTLNYFNGDELAANVWINKYALKDSLGNIYEQSPDDMHHRLASELARIEQRYPNALSEGEIYESLESFKYLVPQGGSMAGIGNPFQIASLSNCFVIGGKGNSDSYGGIMKIDEEQVQLMKRRGGVGFLKGVAVGFPEENMSRVISFAFVLGICVGFGF